MKKIYTLLLLSFSFCFCSNYNDDFCKNRQFLNYILKTLEKNPTNEYARFFANKFNERCDSKIKILSPKI